MLHDLGIRMLPLVNGECHSRPTQPGNLPLEPMNMTMPWKSAGCLCPLLVVKRVIGKVNQEMVKTSIEKELRRLLLGLRGALRREWRFRMTRRGKGDRIGGKG